ncbi:MAG: bifunctional oligoribonuclease/PAP phosphatase NrnA [Candidatus Omnitrophica bacterium]|nr:bifunctional oligoribonuclease/PAP phosphatase NrnA [Candidatus Omnitrophota bacterium]
MREEKRVVEVLKKYDSFLIGSHINPDGDSLGSQLAIASLLKRAGKKVSVLNPNPAPSIYNFLPYKEWITFSCKKDKWEVGVVVDCSEYGRLKEVQNSFSSLPVVVNIDHHISNKKFADVNFLNSSASSTGEMVYRIFKSFPQQFTKEEALLLYVAILTDTNSFKFGTTAYTHQIVGELLNFGLDSRKIQEKIYDVPFSEVKLLELLSPTIQMSKDRKIAWAKITKEMMNEIEQNFGGGEDIAQTDTFVNYLCSIRDIEVAVLFKKLDNGIKASLRSKNSVDVNKIAKIFGGGGHLKASGCSFLEDMEKVEKKVIAEIEKEMGKRISNV